MIFYGAITTSLGASQVALVVKNPPANAGATGDTGSIAWRIPWIEGAWWVQSMGCKELDTTEQLSTRKRVLY